MHLIQKRASERATCIHENCSSHSFSLLFLSFSLSLNLSIHLYVYDSLSLCLLLCLIHWFSSLSGTGSPRRQATLVKLHRFRLLMAMPMQRTLRFSKFKRTLTRQPQANIIILREPRQLKVSTPPLLLGCKWPGKVREKDQCLETS